MCCSARSNTSTHLWTSSSLFLIYFNSQSSSIESDGDEVSSVDLPFLSVTLVNLVFCLDHLWTSHDMHVRDVVKDSLKKWKNFRYIETNPEYKLAS